MDHPTNNLINDDDCDPALRLAASRDAADRAAKVSLARQSRGQIDALASLDAQRTLAETEADFAAARRAVALAQIDLFRALGGGWTGG